MWRARGGGCAAPPPPAAGGGGAGPRPATRGRTTARRSRPGVRVSVMAGKAPPVAAGEHRPERGGIHGEYEDHVGDREGDEDPHAPEVPVAGRLKTAEQRREPGKL